MSNILLMVDNSNIHVPTVNTYGADARFSYSKMEKLFYGDSNILEKHIVGSTPPAQDTFWDRMRQDGYVVHTYERKINHSTGRSKEKGVDGAVIARGTKAIIEMRPDLLVLLGGDTDMRALVEIAQEFSCKIHVWSYKSSISPEIRSEADKVFYIEDYLNDLLFFQSPTGIIESYVERNDRIVHEQEERRQEEWRRQEAEKKEERHEEKENKPMWKKVLKGVGIAAAVVVAVPVFAIAAYWFSD